MKILEVREGFIKFESVAKISLSSFIQVSGEEKRYIAQVVQVKRSGESQIAYAKILFLYDGSLRPYDKTLPNKDCEITEFTFDIINKSLDSTQPLIVGKFIDNEINIPLDKTCFNKKLLISSDNPTNLTTIVQNLKKQFLHTDNVVIIDMLGNFDMQKYIAGKDFKLPLNTESLAFMYEDCLNDATTDSKSLIKEIFQDLSEYSKTVPFLPFAALKTIVDEMVDKSHIFKLLVLKNKLEKFDKQGYFAGSVSESENLNKILSQKTSIIDLSKLDSIFQNRYLEVILSTLEKNAVSTQIFVNVSNAINKKNIKNIITNDNISSVFVTHSKFKYINEIKTMFDNFIIEPSFTNNEIFKIYSTFLNAMSKDTCLIVGEGTNYIPLVSIIKDFEVEPQQPQTHSEIEESIEENIESKNSTIESIDKKSEELIERVTEEVESSGEILENIFSNEEEEIEELAKNETKVQTEEFLIEENSSVEELNEELETIEDSEKTEIQEKTISDEIFENPEEGTINNDYEEEIIEPEFEQIIEEEKNLVEIEEDEKFINETSLEETESLSTESLELTEEFSAPKDEEIIQITEDILTIDDTEELIQEVPEETNLEFKESSEQVFEEKELEVLPISQEDNFGDIIEINELDETELQENEDIIVVDLEDEGNIEELSEEELLDKEIVSDVDKVFTTMKEDSISDADLDFIDELNEETISEESDFETLENSDYEEITTDNMPEELPEFAPDEDSDDSFLEPLLEVNDLQQEQDDTQEILETRKASTPMVPIYEADIPQEDIVTSDFIEQGDSVTHAKYGHGVVEKMIKYGTKNLYSINFDNVGRRLLDPTLTEIKKA